MEKTKITLSKEELEFALGCAKSYYHENSESDYPNKSDKINEIRYRDLENALCVDNLEIEGYEKVEWVKFDRENPDTYPPRNQYIIAYGPGHITTLYCFSKEAETDEQFANNFSVRNGFTHWKLGPKAP